MIRLSRDYTSIRLAALSEGVIERFIQDYPSLARGRPPWRAEDVRHIEAVMERAIPGKGGLATQWMMASMSQHMDAYPEDLDKFVSLAAWYFAHVKEPLFKQTVAKYADEYGYQPGLNPKNLLGFNRWLLNQIKYYYDDVVASEKINQFPAQLPAGARLYYDDGTYQVIEATDVDAACQLGQGTKWCTATKDHAEEYLEGGPLYIIYRDGQKVAQLFLSLDSNNNIELRNLKNKKLRPDAALNKMLLKSGLTTRILDKIESVGTSGGEMFLDFTGWVDSPYLKKACAQKPWLAYFYAQNIREGRFPEGEKTIASHPETALFYAANIIRHRWPPGEPALLADAWWSSQYRQWLQSTDPAAYEELLVQYP